MIRVLGRRNSSNVRKVMWMIGELGLDVSREDWGRDYRSTDDPAFLAVNPNGLVPAIVDGDFTLWESHAIIAYLDEVYGGARFAPADPKARALRSQWMDWVATRLTPPMFVLFINAFYNPSAQRDAAAMAGALTAIGPIWAVAEARLAQSPYLAGEALTIADFALGPMVHRWFALEIDRPDLPALADYHRRLAERPAFADHVAIGAP